MAQATSIEWTDVSWNPVHGCSKVSPGCAHCYAETLSLRYRQTTKPWTPENAEANVTLKPHKLREPLSKAKPWDKPCRVFVNSMSDLFHELVPDSYILSVFKVMEQAPQHTFQVLTKRPERMRAWYEKHMLCRGCWGDPEVCETPWICEDGYRVLRNVWLGTSIENRRFVDRAVDLKATPAYVHFISAEPLLGPLDGLNLDHIEWLIVGGESGAGHRRIDPAWVRDLRDQAQARGTAFFFKQWGGRTPKAGGRTLDGEVYDEMPDQSSEQSTNTPFSAALEQTEEMT